MEDHPALLGQLLMLTALPTLRKPSGKTSVQPETSGKFGNLSRLPPSLTSIFQTSIPKFQASQISHSQLCFPHEEAVLSVEVWRFQSKYISWNSKACQPVGDSRSYVLAFGNKNPWRKSTTSCEQCFKQPKRYSVNVSLAITAYTYLFVFWASKIWYRFSVLPDLPDSEGKTKALSDLVLCFCTLWRFAFLYLRNVWAHTFSNVHTDPEGASSKK